MRKMVIQKGNNSERRLFLDCCSDAEKCVLLINGNKIESDVAIGFHRDFN